MGGGRGKNEVWIPAQEFLELIRIYIEREPRIHLFIGKNQHNSHYSGRIIRLGFTINSTYYPANHRHRELIRALERGHQSYVSAYRIEELLIDSGMDPAMVEEYPSYRPSRIV